MQLGTSPNHPSLLVQAQSGEGKNAPPTQWTTSPRYANTLLTNIGAQVDDES